MIFDSDAEAPHESWTTVSSEIRTEEDMDDGPREVRAVVRKTPKGGILFSLIADRDLWRLRADMLPDDKPETYLEAVASLVNDISAEFEEVAICGLRQVALSMEIPANVSVQKEGALPPATVERALVAATLPRDEAEALMSETISVIRERFMSDPNLAVPPIDDETPRAADETAAFHLGKAKIVFPPAALLLGGAGAGKSSLIGDLFGVRSSGIPPSGVSRTTLSPLVMTNLGRVPGRPAFIVAAFFRPRREIVGMIRQRIASACLASRSEVDQEMCAAPDQTFDLRTLLGPSRPRNARWSGIRDAISHLRSLPQGPLYESFVNESLVLDDVAAAVADEILDTLKSLPFGELVEDETGFVFLYASDNRAAAIEASRRFLSAKRKHWGRSFAAIVRETNVFGPFLPDYPDFSLVDHRGIDHANGEVPVPDDVLAMAREVDRVIVVESCEKPGSRETVRALADLLSRGVSKPILFVGTKSDIVQSAGEDPAERVRNGLRNAMSAIGGMIGEGLAAQVAEDLKRCPPFVFGGMETPCDHPLASGAGENAESASALIAAISAPLARRDGPSAGEIGVAYNADGLKAEIDPAVLVVPDLAREIYGDNERNSADDNHWATIKAESVRLVRAVANGEPVTCQSTRLTAQTSRLLVDAASRFLDRPSRVGRGGEEPDENCLRDALSALREHVSRAIDAFVVKEMIRGNLRKWKKSASLSLATYGKRSTYARGDAIRRMADEFGEKAAPQVAETVKAELRKNAVRVEE